MSLSSGDIIKIVVAFSMPDEVVMQLVTHYLIGTGADVDEGDTLDAIETVLGVAWDHIDALVLNAVTGETIKLSLWDTVAKRFDEVATKSTAVFDGSGSGEMLPHGAAAVLRFFTNQGRRQGRKFVSGLLETQQLNGSWIATAVTALALFAADWINGVTVDSTNVNQGVFDQALESFKGFQQSSAVNTVVGYQRRRKAGVGI